MAVRITSSQYPGQQCSVVLYSPTGNTIPYTNATSTNLGTKTLPFTYAGDDEYGVFEITINSNQAPCTGVAKTPPDGDGNTYKIIKIGDQIWMSENLKTTKFRDGTPLDNTSPVNNETWIAANGSTTRYWAYVNEDYTNSANTETYGLVYNQFAVVGTTDSSSLCPSGYHVPSAAEFSELSTYLGDDSIAGTPLKSTTLWRSSGIGTNLSGFNGIPAGYRPGFGGGYLFLTEGAYYWSTNVVTSSSAVGRRLFYDRTTFTQLNSAFRASGFSVRCIKIQP